MRENRENIESNFINTMFGEPYFTPRTIQITIKFIDPISLSQLGSPPYNPFIIANKDRAREIHLSDMAPTSIVPLEGSNARYFAWLLGWNNDDDSDKDISRYYKSSNNLPWVLHIPEKFDYPFESHEITKAYQNFATWAESSGTTNKDWHKDFSGNRNSDYIYKNN